MQPPESSICPTCQSPIPADAPGGLCPACTLQGAAAASHATTGGGRTPPPSIEEIAPHFPELELLELLGAGGMGAVYKARQPQLDRTVALKILSHELAQDPAFVERFNREAKMLARLSHPNIVTVFDFGTAGPYCYLVMEYVDGVNLRQAMRTGGFKPAEALALVQEVCSALQFAHDEGILHRDIKPENVLIDAKGRVKIADFGIAKLVGTGAPSDVSLTLQGSILGSPHYMAPEQIETPGDVDQRADIYSLGVVLYEMLTGELPIGRFDLPSEKAAMDQRIDEIVLRTLAKERQARFQSAGEVGTQVAALSTGEPPPPPAAAQAASGDTGSARFSLLAAILTGASPILILVFLWLWNADIPELWKLVFALLTLVPGLISALAGFILGARALGEIRKSGGTKNGLGLSVFAVAPWPILLMYVLTSFVLAVPAPTSENSVSFRIILLLSGVSFLIAAVLFVRGVIRLGRGVRRRDGERHFPGALRVLLPAIFFFILGPFLTAVVPRVLPSEGDDEQKYREDMAMARTEVRHSSAVLDGSSPVDWYRGAPEVLLQLRVHDGFRAEFRLVLYDGKGNPLEYAEIGGWEPMLSRGNVRITDMETCLIRVGTTSSEGDRGNRAITALIDSNGESGTLTADTDFAEWNISIRDPAALDFPLATAGTYDQTIATREETADGKIRLTGQLKLEVQLIER